MSVTKKHKVTIANRGGRVLEVGEDETILDVSEANGIPLPVACRYGGCITCAGRLISGSVRQPKGTALNRRQSQASYILMCVAHPKEDCVVEVGVESHTDLYQNPFSVKRPPIVPIKRGGAATVPSPDDAARAKGPKKV